MPQKPINVSQYLEIGCGRCKFGGTPECKVHLWTKALVQLRKILQKTELKEEIKWSNPCYTINGKNVAMISAMKNHAVLSFFQGELFKDPNKLLQLPGEHSRFGRVIKFDDVTDIKNLTREILGLLNQAIELRKSKTKSRPHSNELSPNSIEYPEELIQAFESDPDFQEAFNALTPGRQKSHLLHYTSAKQSKTKVNRINKSREKVFKGKGWNEY